MSGFEGLDPDGLRRVADAADHLGEVAAATADEVRDLAAAGLLDDEMTRPLDEIDGDMLLTADLARLKAEQMEMVVSGLEVLSTGVSGLLDRLERRLSADPEHDRLVGDRAVAAVLAGFGAIDTDCDGMIDGVELSAASVDPALDGATRAAAAHLARQPGLLGHLSSTSVLDHAWRGEHGDPVGPGQITRHGLQTFGEHNAVLRRLTDPQLFDELRGAGATALGAGLADERLEALLADPDVSDAARSVASALLADPRVLLSLGGHRHSSTPAAATRSDSAATLTSVESMVDRVAWVDVASAAIERHAFATDPVAARRFVQRCAEFAAWRDDRLLDADALGPSTDDGVRSLAAAALDGAASLGEQVGVVASLPESTGGVRNELITFYSARLAHAMNVRLNRDRDWSDPASTGHSGANWMQFAPWSAARVGRAMIASDEVAWRRAAELDQRAFGSVAIPWAVFLDHFPTDAAIGSAQVESFFAASHPMPPEGSRRPLFGDAHRHLRLAFSCYLAAIRETDHARRRSLTLTANLLVSADERAGPPQLAGAGEGARKLLERMHTDPQVLDDLDLLADQRDWAQHLAFLPDHVVAGE